MILVQKGLLVKLLLPHMGLTDLDFWNILCKLCVNCGKVQDAIHEDEIPYVMSIGGD